MRDVVITSEVRALGQVGEVQNLDAAEQGITRNVSQVSPPTFHARGLTQNQGLGGWRGRSS